MHDNTAINLLALVVNIPQQTCSFIGTTASASNIGAHWKISPSTPRCPPLLALSWCHHKLTGMYCTSYFGKDVAFLFDMFPFAY